jgi:flagellar basal-body rod modification protein FlgD
MTALTDVSTLSPSVSTPRVAPRSQSLGQDDFLKLMTAQLTSQDPFKPLDNTQMVAQMAQFSQVAGIAEMNASLASIAQQLSGGGRVTDASSWIGRAMLVDSAIAAPLSDGSYRGEFTLAGAAEAVTVALVDDSGATVHSQDFGARGAGEIAFNWDGAETVSGPLHIVVTATNGGAPVATSTQSWTEIGAIQSPAAGQQSLLITPLGMFSPDAALRIA